MSGPAPRASVLSDVHGILLLDKPLGLSSAAAVARTKRLFAARKAGHTGSLDPLASGMLPICLGEATKFGALMLEADKTYRLTLRLGERTPSADLESTVIERRELPPLTARDLERFGIVDVIVEEPTGGAHRDPAAAIAATGDAIAHALGALGGLDRATVARLRREKYLAIGRTLG